MFAVPRPALGPRAPPGPAMRRSWISLLIGLRISNLNELASVGLLGKWKAEGSRRPGKRA